MKKIGILFGKENTFPQAFIDRVNSKNIKGIVAEAVQIDYLEQADPTEYAVIIDRISQDVPYYRAYLKNAALMGTAVINNPFWWSADEKFFNNCLSKTVGVPVPNTVLLPSFDRPNDTSDQSFRNLKYPTSWDKIFDYIKFPAYMKPHDGGGWKSVYRVDNAEDLWKKHGETEQLVMMLQEEIVFDHYFRCYYLAGDRIHVMPYEPRNPHHLRYVVENPTQDKKLLATVTEYTKKLCNSLGYDFNTVEFAVRDGIPIAIDFCNPAPDADINSVGQENFDWIVENAALMAIEKAQNHKANQMNLTWGTFISNQFNIPTGKPAAAPKVATPKAPVKKVAAAKASVTKPAVAKVAKAKPTAAKTAPAKTTKPKTTK